MSPRRVRRVVAATIVAVVLFWGEASAAVLVRGVRASGSFVWKPKTVRIEKGTVVKWRAVNGTHTVTAIGDKWTYDKDLPQGTTVKRTFRKLGTFRFYCTIHGDLSGGVCSGMCGKVVVG